MKTIELTSEHRGGKSSTSFSGRPEGEAVRLQLRLDDKDNDKEVYDIIIPSGTTTFNPSFYLGFLYPSIKKLGLKNFVNKYRFNLSKLVAPLDQLIRSDLNEGMRTSTNELNFSTGLD